MRSWTRETLSDTGAAFMESRILLTAAELDIFSLLNETPVSAEHLATHRNWDVRGLRILLDALTSMELLTKDDNAHYHVPTSVAHFLTAEGTDGLLPLLQHRVRMWKSWSALTEIVQSGKNPNIMAISERTKEDTEAFIGAMDVVGSKLAGVIASALDLKLFTRMLDVGGGPGTYIRAFLKEAPQMTATLFDLPVVLEIGRRKIGNSEVSSRVDFVAGDYMRDELPSGYDLVLLSAVIHSNSREANCLLFAKVFRSLNPGGVLVVRDFIMDESRTHPPDGAIFAVNMLAATRGGDSYTYKELEEDLSRVGFINVRLTRDGTRMDQLLCANKPS